MFRLYHSNDLDVLKGILLKLMQDSPASPFEQEAILVQSQGMAHWLKLQLADGLGVAAQVDFPLPSSFVWQVFNHLQPELPQRSHFDKQIVAWKLLRLLPDLVQQPECAPVAQYLHSDADGLKAYQLAQTIADVFDQYLVYRPDWLLSWEQGVDEVADTDVSLQPWQPHIWRALVADSRELGHSLSHRARLLEQLPSLVAQYPQRLQALPKRLFVFGIAALPGSYWQVLNAISAHIDVHFFLLNPCRNFWGDISSDKQRLRILQQQPNAAHLFDRGNPLLASWGRLGRDFLSLVHEAEAEGTVQDIQAWVEPQPQSLLRYVQQDILELNDRQQGAFTAEALESSAFKQAIHPDDGSVRVISAHSPLREVQRLYDQILYWLDNDPTLKPRDIVVMVPDIDAYAPYIDAVFSSHKAHTHDGDKQHGEYHIPWAIADQSMAQEDPLIDSFLRLLNLPESRLLITDVQDWLDVPAIRARFDLSEDDLPVLRDWLGRARIRWGLDAQHREQLGLPAFEQNSWRKGLRQLLLGLMLPDGDNDFCGDFPVLAAEGNEAERLGKLMAFIDTLEHWQQRLSEPQLSSQHWQQMLVQMLSDLYLADGAEQQSLQRIRDTLQHWAEELQLAAYTGALSATVVRSWFTAQLGQQGGWQRFLAGPVNFCTLMPMRSVPFKAVCLLGMNDEDYPRRVTPVGFDLMVSGKTRRGDRSRREDDRYLFLEAVCSAQQYLYLSYRGRDVRENAELQPSVLVAELLDYLHDGFCLQGDEALPHQHSRAHFSEWLVDELPLQPYNAAQFSQQSHGRQVPGYQHLWASVAVAALAGTAEESGWQGVQLPEPAELNKEQVLWPDVVQALTDPLKFFVRRRLKASLDSDWEQHDTSEPFAPAGLDGYQLKHSWLQRMLAEPERLDNAAAEIQQFTRRQQALGQLPVHAIGKVWSDDITAGLMPLAQSLQVLTRQPMAARTLTVQLDNTRIDGELQQAFVDDASDDSGYLVFSRAGSIRGRDIIQAWLQLVLASAAEPGLIHSAQLLGTDKKEPLQRLILRAPTPTVAQAQLRTALRWYWQCWCGPVLHLPDTLWQLQQELNKISAKTEQEDEQNEALDKWLQERLDSAYGELNFAYLQRCAPEFLQQLNAKAARKWLADFGVLVQAAADHQFVDDHAAAGEGTA